MSNMSNSVPYLIFLAVRTVAAGHQMIMDGWDMFEEVAEAAGTGDLPQLLQSLWGMMMPTPPPPPTPPLSVPMPPQSTTEAVPMAGVSGQSPVKKEEGCLQSQLLLLEG